MLLEIIHCLFHGGLDFVEFGGVEKYNIKKKVMADSYISLRHEFSCFADVFVFTECVYCDHTCFYHSQYYAQEPQPYCASLL